MKHLILFLLITFSLSAFAFETLTGAFTLNHSNYVLTASYHFEKNQEASGKYVSFFESSIFPETGEELPAYCSYNVTFTVPVKILIQEVSTGEIVYVKNTIETFYGSAGGGLLSEGKCHWVMNGWESKVSTQLRVTEHFFLVKNKPFRFFLDTYALISAKGSKLATIIAENYSPKKGNDGRKDGEVWLDTQPDANGNYNRVWFPLSLK